MPVVLVVAPALGAAAERAALAAVNTAIADGLGLCAEDVYSSFVAAGPSMLGAVPVTPWPVVLVHGSARAPEPTAAALAGVRAVVERTWHCAAGECWVQWVAA